MPFLQAIGYDIYDPTEIRPEYVADFARKRSNGQLEKIDYALYIHGEISLFVECKAIDSKLENHDGQLARYFNSTPSVKVAVLTNGLTYRFFTDLREPNIMDSKPFLEFDILLFTERHAEELKPFTKENFNVHEVKHFAEEFVSLGKVKTFIDEVLRNPSEEFIYFVLDKLDLISGKITKNVLNRFSPIVKKAVQSALLDMMTKSIQQEIAPTSSGTTTPSLDTNVVTLPTNPSSLSNTSSESASGDGIVTTEEELEIFGIVNRLCSESSLKTSIQYKDTVNYFGINIGQVNRWFLCVFCNGSRKHVTTKLSIEQTTLLTPGFTVEPSPEVFGKSRVYFNHINDIERLRTLVLVSYEEEVRRRDNPPVHNEVIVSS